MITIKVSQIACDAKAIAVINTESRNIARSIIDALKFKLHVNEVLVDGKKVVELGKTEKDDL